MTRSRPSKQRPPLDAAKLDELALSYVGRFATSRSKLASYLQRKVRERGWGGTTSPDIAALVERLSGLGYVDDRAFAMAKARSLTGRGYGERRVGQALGAAGIEEQDGIEAREFATNESVEAALRFAKRRRIGPYAQSTVDVKQRERNLAAMIRAGHPFALSKIIVDLSPDQEFDPEMLM